MGLVVGVLKFSSAAGLLHGGRHGRGDLVGIENDHALGVSGRAADGLDEGGLRAEKALLVGVQDGDQGDFRQVQALPQEVDAHQHVEVPQTQVPDDLHALDGVDVVVHISHTDACALQIVGQVLGHFFGQGRDQDALLPGSAGVDLADEVIDLPLHRADLHEGVQQPGGTDDLLHDLARTGALVFTGGGGDINDLVQPLGKLLKVQRPVVKGAGQAEAVVHQGRLSRPVPGVHGPDLGEGDMALVNEHEEVFREVVQ